MRINDLIDAIAQQVLRFTQTNALAHVFVCGNTCFGLFGNTSLLSQVDFGFENFQDFQNHGWRQTAGRF